MVRFTTITQILQHSWEDVTAAFWQKYPNPFSKHVLSCDVVHRHCDADTQTLRGQRLMTKTNRKPKWMEKWIDNSNVFVLEDAVVDLRKKTMTTFTRNVTLTTYMCVEERTTYRPSEEDPSCTVVTTEARVVSNLFIAPMVERFGAERFKYNNKKATEGLLHVLNLLAGKAEPQPAT
eukprot:m.163762 g.163762  ORF g.163762 m.163762 type:complete len:177 (+) comp21041_c2_seq2:86-616(+)